MQNWGYEILIEGKAGKYALSAEDLDKIVNDHLANGGDLFDFDIFVVDLERIEELEKVKTT